MLIFIEHFKYITCGHRDLMTKRMDLIFQFSLTSHFQTPFVIFTPSPGQIQVLSYLASLAPWPSFSQFGSDGLPLSLGSASTTLVYRTPPHLSGCSSNVTCSLKPPATSRQSAACSPCSTLPPHPLNDHKKQEDQALGGSTLFELIRMGIAMNPF